MLYLYEFAISNVYLIYILKYKYSYVAYIS